MIKVKSSNNNKGIAQEVLNKLYSEPMMLYGIFKPKQSKSVLLSDLYPVLKVVIRKYNTIKVTKSVLREVTQYLQESLGFKVYNDLPKRRRSLNGKVKIISVK